jgi:hypothetical protein
MNNLNFRSYEKLNGFRICVISENTIYGIKMVLKTGEIESLTSVCQE